MYNQPELNIDFQAITKLFDAAKGEGRDFLFEYETYRLLAGSGAETPPRTHLLAKGDRPTDEELAIMPGDRVVLKIVSPHIIHKTEVGGVRVVVNKPDKIRATWRRMLYEVPENLAERIEQDANHAPAAYRNVTGDALRAAIARDIVGILMVQFMPPDSEAFGNELIVGIRHTREFGMVISAGLGGTDTELYAERFRKGQAIVAASTAMTDGPTFFTIYKKTISYKKLAGLTRGTRRIITDEQLLECFSSFIAMGNYYSTGNPEAPHVIEELEINPFAFTDYLMVPLDGMCRFTAPGQQPVPRPFHKVGSLLRPKTIGLIGISSNRVNFGRIILGNILAGGFPAENIRIIKPGIENFEGIKCLPGLAALDVHLDLLVVAVGADQVPELVDQVLSLDVVEAVMLIPGGMGETRDSFDRAQRVMGKISAGHLRENGGPVFLGANCLGVVSHPGRYDTMFIPEAKLPKKRGSHRRTAAFVSQSGAFMISRLSKRPELDPAYMISVGNQNDLTLGDIVKYLGDDPDLDIIAIYAEGFKDLDGLEFCQAVRKAVLAGKDIIFYKAGTTPEGKSATSGHTASLAGDYVVCESCVRQAGGMVARTFTQFEDLLMIAQRLHGKVINGNRLAAVSGAGFEAVGIADNIQAEDFSLKMATLSPATAENVAALLDGKGLGALTETKNPLDITPGADDETHVAAVAYLADDPNIDAVVVGLDPLSPAMHTLLEVHADGSKGAAPQSIVRSLPTLAERLSKPVVGVVDGGRLYDPMVDELVEKGMAIFRSSDRAVQALAMYIDGRLYAERLRNRGY